jgi:uncharacterized membrane protein
MPAPTGWTTAVGNDRVAYRALTAAVAGSLAALVAALWGLPGYALVIGWLVAASLFLAWTWRVIGRLDPLSTAVHATREDATQPLSHAILGVASLASLVAVAYLLTLPRTDDRTTTAVAAAFCLASVAASWATVNTLFTLRYARLYYRSATREIDFNQPRPPTYADFAYLAFTVGMTYQVSDTDLRTPEIRATTIRHALLSFMLSAIVLATTINLVAGLSGR